jgi:predicted acetyltransferase
MVIRTYDPGKDKDAIARMWREVGWIGKDTPAWLDTFLEVDTTFIAEVEGQAESLASTEAGIVKYLDEELPFCLVAAVCTSHIARKRGAPKLLVARALARAVEEGALVAGLGMFDQGFYDQVGFGTGGYEHWVRFDPAAITVPVPYRTPRRLSAQDWELVHASRVARRRAHGACTVTDPRVTQLTLQHHERGFGLGYCDGPNGELTHHLWFSAGNFESGPYHVQWMAFRSREQFLELMAVIRSLGDQVRLVTMQEPSGIQVQDLLDRPFRHQEVTEGSRWENRINARAWWQARILDLPGCLARTHLGCADLQFNLRLADPVALVRDDGLLWRGIGGEYVVTLGVESRAEAGFDPALPALEASVNAFTRLWLGVRPATGLAYTDDLAGPEELLSALDTAFCIPEPKPDWDF